MKDKIIEKMLSIAKSPEFIEINTVGDSISIRYENGVIISNPDTLFIDLNKDDFKVLNRGDKMSKIEAIHMAISGQRTQSNAIIMTQGPYCKIVGKYCKKLPALLDDFAQIVGWTARVAKTDSLIDILKALASRNAAITKEYGSVTIGRTLEEAFTAALVLEKVAKVYVSSSIISRPKKIGRIECLLMNVVYKKKYSKDNQERLMEQVYEEN